MKTMLIVNDDKQTARDFQAWFHEDGFKTKLAFTETQAYAELNALKPDIVLLDMDLKGFEEDCSGITILRHIRKKWNKRELPVIILSRYLDGDKIKRVEELGINPNDYAPLPVADLRRLLRHVNSYFETPEKMASLPFPHDARPYFRAPQSIECLKKLKQLAAARKDILLLGEPGCGKTRLAHYYYELLQEKRGPQKLAWVRIGCVEYSETLFEANVFGSRTGHPRQGLLEKGKHGVVFLDDLAYLPKSLQSKMLDLLATKQYRPLGAHATQTLDCVFVLALHIDKQNPNFDETFLSRLKRMSTLHIPPLRERPEDIRGLVERLMAKFSAKYKRQILNLDPQVIRLLKTQAFPGNLSDLEAIVEDGMLTSPNDCLTVDDIMPVLQSHRKLHLLEESEANAPIPLSGEEPAERFGLLCVLPKKYEAYLGKERLALRPMEFELLRLLIQHSGNVVSYEAMMRALHSDPETVVTENTLATHVKHLRKKLGFCKSYIKNQRGAGYKLSE